MCNLGLTWLLNIDAPYARWFWLKTAESDDRVGTAADRRSMGIVAVMTVILLWIGSVIEVGVLL